MKHYNNSGRVVSLLAMAWLVVLLPSLSLARWSQPTSQEANTKCRTYSVRRIEFIGNQNTRDRIVRRRITFSEGKALSEEDIQHTIKNLSRLKRLENLKREDIEINYAVEDLATPDWHCFADILIHVKEKKRR